METISALAVLCVVNKPGEGHKQMLNYVDIRKSFHCTSEYE